MLTRKDLKNIDFLLLAAVGIIVAMSLVVLSSAAAGLADDPFYYTERQALWAGIGLGLVIITLIFDYKTLARMAPYLYLVNLALLGSVLLVGTAAKGAQRWIDLGPFAFQPSEFSKLLLIVTLAYFLARRQGRLNRLRDFLPVFLFVVPSVLLVFRQPDLGTAMVLVVIMVGMLFLAGANIAVLGSMVGAVFLALVLVLVGHFHWGLPLPLEEYQVQRLVVFLDPYADGMGGRGAGYHIIQSEVAVGSGYLWGKGLGNGSQSQLEFLPEPHTDFIFSVVGEELGFFRSAFLLAMYLIVIWRCLEAARKARDDYGALLAGGVAAMFLFHVLVNVGMTIGLMPITGIPLPLFSYGGSSMLSNLLALGLVLNVRVRSLRTMF
ncbi:MAG: rod shape-determining protein RodA [Clostridia bacterium]|nr:MAG: rod shape-determining protein RodA [Clostridia bacterium]